MSRKAKSAVLLKMKGWEGTYVGGNLVEQGAPLRKDMQVEYFMKLADRHNFDPRELKEFTLEPKDQAMVNEQYILPDKITKLHGKYGTVKA